MPGISFDSRFGILTTSYAATVATGKRRRCGPGCRGQNLADERKDGSTRNIDDTFARESNKCNQWCVMA